MVQQEAQSVGALELQVQTHADHAVAVQRSWWSDAKEAFGGAVGGVKEAVGGALDSVRRAALAPIRSMAHALPGYDMLGLALGRDAISRDTVERNPKNVFWAVLGVVPGGGVLFQNLDQSGAVDKAFDWL